MFVIHVENPGPHSRLVQTERPMPTPGPHDLLVAVGAVGVNRADLLQRKGFYPAPVGESDILGLEISGKVAAMGEKVRNFQVGERVFGLVMGGGYASHCLLDARLAMRTPDHWSDAQAAAVPEVFFTASETLCQLGQLKKGESVLIHAGGSGVGSTAIQMAAHIGAQIFSTVGSPRKLEPCRRLGCHHPILYKSQSFLDYIRTNAKDGGVDLILDFIGAKYFEDHLKALKPRGRLVVVGLLGGRQSSINLATLIAKQIKIFGSIMRPLGIEYKMAIKQRCETLWWDALHRGTITAQIHCCLPLTKAEEAHRILANSEHFGKLILTHS